MKIKLKKIEQGICPYCGSIDIDWGFAEFDDDMVGYSAICKTCNRAFEEWYELAFAGHNVGSGCEIVTQAGEEGIEIEIED